MAKLTKEDFGGKDEIELAVKITEPHFQAADKDGDKCRMALVLRGVTSDGTYIDYYSYFTNSIFASGKNKGRRAFDVAAEQCYDMGMPKPFNPGDVGMLDGVDATFVCGLEEYENKLRPKVKFVNTGKKPALPLGEAANIWAQLSGEAVPPVVTTSKPKPTAVAAASDNDDLPF